MAKKRVALELGMGTSLRSGDYTRAAIRAVSDALWHNSLNMADAFGFPRDAMIVDVQVATQQPDEVKTDEVAAIFPYGQVSVTSVFGGMDIPKRRVLDEPMQGEDKHAVTIFANAAIIVSFDMEKNPSKARSSE